MKRVFAIALLILAAVALVLLPAGRLHAQQVQGYPTIQLPNDSSTGTQLNRLVKLTSSGTAVTVSTTDTGGVMGVCIANCGTSRLATVQVGGLATIEFDNTATPGDFVQISPQVDGMANDFGASVPMNQIIGRVVGTSACSGTCSVELMTPADVRGDAMSMPSVQTYTKGVPYTPGNLGCLTAPATIVDCPAAFLGQQLIGVNMPQTSDALAAVVARGQATVLTAVATQFNFGDVICADPYNRGKVVSNGQTACPPTRHQVGIVVTPDTAATTTHTIMVDRPQLLAPTAAYPLGITNGPAAALLAPCNAVRKTYCRQ